MHRDIDTKNSKERMTEKEKRTINKQKIDI